VGRWFCCPDLGGGGGGACGVGVGSCGLGGCVGSGSDAG